MAKAFLKPYSIYTVTLLLVLNSTVAQVAAQSTAFTYQGKLTDSGNLANGNFDFQFKLFDTVTVGTGTQQSSTVTVSNVTVNNGIFTVQLDFGACPTCFNGAARFLEIAVKPSGGGSFTTLSPRQPVTSNPYAIRSLNAANATTADGLSVACVNCVTSSQIQSVNGSAVTGQIPVASVPAGSANYIQNTSSQQASSNFNISGNGILGGMLSANAVNVATQFNLGGSRVLSAAGSGNLFAGVNAGASNTTGGLNSFFGGYAGAGNSSGRDNAFFGAFAGGNNTLGNSNAFFGRYAGLANTTGSNTTLVGSNAGLSNTTENENTFVGASSNGVAGITNATAIGAQALVTQSNSLILGSINGVNNATTDTNVGIGTTAPAAKLHVRGVSPLRMLGDTTTLSGAEAVDFFAWSSIYGTDLGGMRIQRQVSSGNIDTILFAAGSGNSAAEVMRVSGNGSVNVTGILTVATLGSAGGILLCRNASNQIAICSSSLRYKSDVRPFSGGLDLINRLRPIRFTWKQGGLRDLGMAAEEVEKVEPLLVTYNAKGEVEGVKYDRVAVVLLNAVKEQQRTIEQQHQRIEALTKLVCSTHRKAKACK